MNNQKALEDFYHKYKKVIPDLDWDELEKSYIGYFESEDDIIKYLQEIINDNPSSYDYSEYGEYPETNGIMTGRDLWWAKLDDKWTYVDGLLFTEEMPTKLYSLVND